MEVKKTIFMGTSQFAVPTLEKLAETKYRHDLCVTQPDRPKGRNRKLQSPIVKHTADELDIPIIQPENINAENVIAKLKKINPDVIIVVAYGGYLKKTIRKIAKFGAINLHPSLLPKYRGAAPINYTLFNGDSATGNTIFKIVAKMDAGPILYQNKIEILPEDNYTTLYKKLSQLGAKDILETLKKIESDNIQPKQQNESEATYTEKIKKKDKLINWNNPAEKIFNQVRGLALKPGATASLREKRIKILEIDILKTKSQKEPGTFIKEIKNKGLVVATKDNDILIKKLQPAGKRVMNAYSYNLGARLQTGEHFANGF